MTIGNRRITLKRYKRTETVIQRGPQVTETVTQINDPDGRVVYFDEKKRDDRPWTLLGKLSAVMFSVGAAYAILSFRTASPS